jgi:Asp/Glu/hydantoin racemase
MSFRIWHQSISELDHLPAYRTMLSEHARRVTRPDTVVDLHGMRAGTYPSGVAPIDVLANPWCHYLANVQIVDAAIRAEAEGYDAVAVTCFHDPALHEARSVVDIPVVSMCESTVLLSCSVGARLGLVGIGPANVELVADRVRHYGLSDRVAAIVALETAVTEHDVDARFSEPSAMTRSFKTAARQVIAAGADVVVPCESLLNTSLVRQGVTAVDDVPVIDALAMMLTHAESLVQLGRSTGLPVGRGCGGTRPDPASVRAIRAAAAATLAD